MALHGNGITQRQCSNDTERDAWASVEDKPGYGRQTDYERFLDAEPKEKRESHQGSNEGDGDPHPCYRRETLDTAAERLARRLHGGRDAFVFFNNDERACALHDASVFARACTVRGLPSTRTPDAGQFM